MELRGNDPAEEVDKRVARAVDELQGVPDAALRAPAQRAALLRDALLILDNADDPYDRSIKGEGGEVGWTSYARGGNTVEYGADAPPQMDILPKSLLPQALRGS